MIKEGDYYFIIEDEFPVEHTVHISYDQDGTMRLKPTEGHNLITNEWTPSLTSERLCEALNNVKGY